MAINSLFSAAINFIRLVSPPSDNPELLKAQHRAFSRQLPVMYFLLVSSTWTVAITHTGIAPTWLTFSSPLAMTFLATLRCGYWLQARRVDPAPEVVQLSLVHTIWISSLIAVGLTSWALLLYPYGNEYDKAQLAFYMAITAVGIIFSLMFLQSAAFIVAVIVNGTFIVFFFSTREPTFIAAAFNVLVVTIALLVAVTSNYRGFTLLIRAQTESRQKELAQKQLLRMIDDMPVAVMTVDLKTFDINYANETSKRTLRRIEHLLPRKVDEIVGTSIDGKREILRT